TDEAADHPSAHEAAQVCLDPVLATSHDHVNRFLHSFGSPRDPCPWEATLPLHANTYVWEYRIGSHSRRPGTCFAQTRWVARARSLWDLGARPSPFAAARSMCLAEWTLDPKGPCPAGWRSWASPK